MGGKQILGMSLYLFGFALGAHLLRTWREMSTFEIVAVFLIVVVLVGIGNKVRHLG